MVMPENTGTTCFARILFAAHPEQKIQAALRRAPATLGRPGRSPTRPNPWRRKAAINHRDERGETMGAEHDKPRDLLSSSGSAELGHT